MNAESDSPLKDIRWVDRTVVAEVVGDINAARVPVFQQAILSVLDKKPDRIIVNLSGVAYMDSAGLASLVKLLSRARKYEAELYLVGMNEMIRGLFEITRLDGVFEIRDTEEEALG